MNGVPQGHTNISDVIKIESEARAAVLSQQVDCPYRRTAVVYTPPSTSLTHTTLDSAGLCST